MFIILTIINKQKVLYVVQTIIIEYINILFKIINVQFIFTYFDYRRSYQ